MDQGVKQSEGQFFTPMPIVKFILKSLPLEQIIHDDEQVPKVIDYACGAGHFLNEYAQEIKAINLAKNNIEIKNYYDGIVGIEKEYRLSKVAKVSAFMYGQDEIKIIYSDALATTSAIKDNDYSVLVANPPYSVKGFLETLSEVDRKKYQLIDAVDEKNYPNNNSIEAFFIERAKQLLKPGGVAGIIVPSSILTKGKTKSTSKTTNVYVATREILLKFFDIVAVAEFGGGTFGKTGTSTVTLFLRRKEENPSPSDHFLNRVNTWFAGDKSKDNVFEDEYLIHKYCNHLEIKFVDYRTLLLGDPSEALLDHDVFKEYLREFANWTEVKNRKKNRIFKALSKEKQDAEMRKLLITYLINNEKDKLYYFVLAFTNPQDVLIIKSPSKTTAMKEFLGYEWSSAKGKEGIKYLADGNGEEILENENIDDDDVELEDDDKRVLVNIFNLNNIITPLYDPQDKENKEKINQLIQSNYLGEEIFIPENLKEFVSYSSLVEMLNFNKVDFNKFITLTPRTTFHFESRWESRKLSDVAYINPSKSEIKGIKDETIISFVEMAMSLLTSPLMGKIGCYSKANHKQIVVWNTSSLHNAGYGGYMQNLQLRVSSKNIIPWY